MKANEMTLRERAKYFLDQVYNRPLLDYYNKTIYDLRRDGSSEEAIKPLLKLRRLEINNLDLRNEQLKAEYLFDL